MTSTILEKTIRSSIKQIEKELEKIDYILNANPLSDIIQLERDTILKAKEMPNKEALAYVKLMIKKRNSLFALARKQRDSVKLINRKVKLQSELNDLTNEFFHIERTKA